jgi:hypothetical protein
MERRQAALYLRRMADAGDLLDEPAERGAAFRHAARLVAGLSERGWARWLAERDRPLAGCDPAAERALRRYTEIGRAHV